MAGLPAFSQTAKEKKNKEILNRSGDHFMVQLSSDHWIGAPDSVSSHIKGFARGLNVYVMYDMKFKANPRFSIAGGLGVGTSNIYFKKMNVGISSTNPKIPFTATDSVNNYKKYKLNTAFLEVPIEFRFSSKPETPGKSIKVAVGVKLGTMLGAHTKGKILRTASGTVLSNATDKVSSKSYFNTTRVALTGRIGYGNFTLFGAYNLTSMYKAGVAADVKLLQVGLTISGL
ncbi:hypothetical protein BH11BAC4_BH11BAC4_08460 [soil metagenome]